MRNMRSLSIIVVLIVLSVIVLSVIVLSVIVLIILIVLVLILILFKDIQVKVSRVGNRWNPKNIRLRMTLKRMNPRDERNVMNSTGIKKRLLYYHAVRSEHESWPC
jgi:hypothetical protein